jgi:pilus assembly protein CpaB
MDRRFLTVLVVSLVFALVISGIFYQVLVRGRSGAAGPPPEMKDLVVAAKPLPVGVTIKPEDVKVIKVPAAHFPNGGVSRVEEVLDRPVVSNILMDEPVHVGRLAQRGSGVGLAPIIPPGMRAVSIRVDQVVGVSGFVLPGMRVDVLLTGSPPSGEGKVTVTVLQNIQVLSAGQAIEPDARGHAMNATTVTLLVTPQQAEILTLAANEGRVQLVLRNGTDQQLAQTEGKSTLDLYRRVAAPSEEKAPPRAAPPPAPKPEGKAPARPAPDVDQIVVFRGTQKTVEVVRAAAATEGGLRP